MVPLPFMFGFDYVFQFVIHYISVVDFYFGANVRSNRILM